MFQVYTIHTSFTGSDCSRIFIPTRGYYCAISIYVYMLAVLLVLSFFQGHSFKNFLVFFGCCKGLGLLDQFLAADRDFFVDSRRLCVGYRSHTFSETVAFLSPPPPFFYLMGRLWLFHVKLINFGSLPKSDHGGPKIPYTVNFFFFFTKRLIQICRLIPPQTTRSPKFDLYFRYITQRLIEFGGPRRL